MGFLLWDISEEKTMDSNLGSRLKTPVLPIWVTCINEQWGVLFNPNKDLMKSYSAENRWDLDTDFTISDPTLSRFHLFYYSSTVVGKDPKDTLLIIDTRGVKVQTSDNLEDDYDDVEEDPLANAIQTKYKNLKFKIC